MLVSLYYGQNKGDKKEVTQFSDLSNQDKNYALYGLERLQNNLHHINFRSDNFATALSITSINERIAEHFTYIKKNILSLCHLIIKEHTFPRDMSVERDWSNEIIKKNPFILTDTIKDIYANISFLLKEEALANHFHWVSQETRETIRKEKKETFEYLKAFIPLFKNMHPNVDFTVDEDLYKNEIEAHLKEITSLNLKLNFKDLLKVLSIFGRQRDYYDDLGAKASAFNETYTPEMDDVMQTLWVLKQYNAFSYKPNILGFMITKLFDENQHYHYCKKFVNDNSNFEKFFNHEIYQTKNNVSLYDTKENIERRIQEIISNKEKMNKDYNKRYNNSLITLEKFKNSLFSWCEMFNSSFSPIVEETKRLTPETYQDCKILSFNSINFVLLPIILDSADSQFRGVLLNDEQFKYAIKQNSISDTILNEWDILGENPQKILSTSFKNIDNFLTEINQQEHFEFIFKASNKNLVVL